MYRTAGEAVRRARGGGGPTLLEYKTYRYMGHSRFEASNYRTKEEVAQWKERDPLPRFRRQLGRATFTRRRSCLSAIEDRHRAGLEAAIRFAEASPEPDPQDYRKYIFFKPSADGGRERHGGAVPGSNSSAKRRGVHASSLSPRIIAESAHHSESARHSESGVILSAAKNLACRGPAKILRCAQNDALKRFPLRPLRPLRRSRPPLPAKTIVAALRQALIEEMTHDERVVLLGEDIGVFGGSYRVTEGLWEMFGESRVRDTPISEIAIVGAAVGAAMTGLRPVAEIQFNDFLACAMDQLCNQAAKLRFMMGGQVSVPMVVRAPTAPRDGRPSTANRWKPGSCTRPA